MSCLIKPERTERGIKCPMCLVWPGQMKPVEFSVEEHRGRAIHATNTGVQMLPVLV